MATTYKYASKKKRMPRSKVSKNTYRAVKKIVKQELSQELELKHFDQQIDVSATSSFSGGWLKLSLVSQGLGDTQRIGDVITVKSIQARMLITRADATNIVRVALIQWHEDDFVTNPSFQNVLQYTSGVLLNADLMSPRQIDKDGKFSVLFDKIYSLEDTGDSSQIVIDVFKNKGFRKRLQYTNASTTGENQFYLLFVSDSAAATHPSIEGIARLRYTDA